MKITHCDYLINQEYIYIYRKDFSLINFTKFQEDRAILLSNKAAASLKMGQKEKAIEDCTEALELNPNYVKALLRRAQTYEDTDKPHEAMKDFEKILELDPGNKDARMAVLV